MHIPIKVARLVVGLACVINLNVWAAGKSIKTACGGTLSAPMLQVAVPYQNAVASLKGSEVGWCLVASELSDETPIHAAMWEFVSAAYVMHALQGKKRLNPAQLTAVQALLRRIPGVDVPPTRLKEINTTLYVHMRTLAAQDSSQAAVALDGIKVASPAVFRTLIRRSARWGDADDNGE